MPVIFKRLSIAEFALLLDRFPFTRRITDVHMHHTWRPNRAQFRGHDSIVAMWRFHTQERHFSDIAQHLTIDPEGYVWTGRNWNLPPASAAGFNGNSANGPFMFEIVGDFDHGMDALEGAQRDAVLDVIRLVQARFGLEPDKLRFHNQMSPKSCPGTGIDRAGFLALVREHAPAVAAAGQRDSSPGPFAASFLAANEAVSRAIALLTEEGAVRTGEPPTAELDYGDQTDSALLSGQAARGVEDELSADAIELLRPHVVNLRMGAFSSDGKMTSTPGDVDALFDDHLARWVKARRADDVAARILFFAHGGLVKESTALVAASHTRDWWLRNGVYPIYFIWETGLFETLGDLLTKVKHKAAAEGARDVFDWTSDPIIEEAARALQTVRIWGAMKASAALASAAQGGAHYVAERLHAFLDANAEGVELHAVGHSAGSIFHGHFLPACHQLGVRFESLQLLAPAITCDDFKRYLAAISADGGQPPFTTMYTMNRTLERADNCAQVYRKSLLYLVSEACEPERKTPILGLEDFLRKDAQLQAFFGLKTPASSGAVVWSKSPTETGRSATRSTSHGGFDDDAPTMESVLRRIRKLQDADPVQPFPTLPTGRDATRDWTAEVDWPEAFDRKFNSSAPSLPVSTTGTPIPPMRIASSSGRRRAVCFGINAYPTAPLSGCVKDAQDWHATLTRLGFDAQDKPIEQDQSTRERMLAELNALIAGSRAGDTLVFQYSGHGTQVEDLDGDEANGDTPGLDEALCPIDFDQGHFLVDDDIAEQVALLPAGVRLTFLLDCCHSGTGTRFAARTLSRPPPGGAMPRYVVPSAGQQERHRRFRGETRLAGRGLLSPARKIEVMREVTFAACRSKEVAWEVDGQGEFTRRAHGVLASGVDGLTNAGFLEAVLKAFGSNARQQPQLDCDVALRTERWLGV